MSNGRREPRSIRLDCDQLGELARRYSPVLRFHERERFYPVLAESWLTHVTEAPWTSDPAHHLGDLRPDPHRRGAALMEVDELRVQIGKPRSLRVMAGQPVGGSRPLQLDLDPDDPYAIGRPDLRTVDRDTFISIAGWLGEDLSAGDADRLYALFSELAAAFNPNDEWTPLDGLADLPHAWIPQPVNPTTYCEARWANELTELGRDAGLKDFPLDDGQLNGYLVLTYHYLYPCREPGLDGVGHRLEGQWEAVSLFFRGEGGHGVGGLVEDIPEHVVVSQGIDQSSNHHRTAHREWGNVTLLEGSDHPVLYVAVGTHRFYFEPVVGLTTDPNDPTKPRPTGTDPGSHDDDRKNGSIGDAAILGTVLLGIAGVVAAVLGGLLGLVFFLAVLFWLFKWLADLFDTSDNEGSGEPIPASEGNDEASDHGTQAGGATEEPAPAPGASSGGGPGAGYGLPNTGSPTGRDTISFDVRVVDRVFDDPRKPTGYPSRQPCESPTWWDYSGGWGVRVFGGLATGWRSGTRRVDEHGRSWAYWNGLRLSTVRNGGKPEG